MTQQEFQTRYKYNPSTDCIGEGGFGKVYKAYDTHLDKLVAIKVAEVKPGQEQVRLKKEVELVSKLPTHPNIANYEACYTFSSFTGEYDFAVLQYYEEGNLQQLIDSGKLNQTQKEALLRQILEGVEYLHNQEIIHRDLKPQNILIAKRNDEYIPKITDFGISKKLDLNKSSVFTNSLAGAGTMAYASPEQLLGKTIKKNTDLWSFGVIVCQVFTGKLPFSVGRDGINSEAGRIELYKQIVNGTISFSNNSIPAKWQQLIKQCIVVDNNIRVTKAEICISIFNSNQNLQNGATTVIEGIKSNITVITEGQDSPLKSTQEYYNRAIYKIKINNFLSAIEDLTEAIKLQEYRTKDLHYKRGFCYQQLNKFSEAIKDYTFEFKLFGWNALIISKRATCYSEINEIEKASADYIALFEINKEKSFFDKWFRLAEKAENPNIIESFIRNSKLKNDINSVSGLREQFDNVYELYFRKFPDILLSNDKEYFKRALIKIDLLNYKAAIEDIDEAIKFSLSKEYFLKRAFCNQKINKFENAIEDYTQALRVSSKEKTVFENRANCWLRIDQTSKAADDFISSLELSWDNNCYKQWFELASKSGNETMLIRFLYNLKIENSYYTEKRKEVLEYYFKNYPDAILQKANEYFERANFKMSLNKYSSAINDYNEAINKNCSKGYYEKRGNCYYKLKLYEEAISDYSEELTLYGKPYSLLHERGVCYELVGDVDKACDDFFSALKIEWNELNFNKWLNIIDKSKNQSQIKEFYSFQSRFNQDELLFAKAKVAFVNKEFTKCINFIEEINKKFQEDKRVLDFFISKARYDNQFKLELKKSSLLKLNSKRIQLKKELISNNIVLMLSNAIYFYSLCVFVVSEILMIEIFPDFNLKALNGFVRVILLIYLFIMPFGGLFKIIKKIKFTKNNSNFYFIGNRFYDFIEKFNLSVIPILLSISGVSIIYKYFYNIVFLDKLFNFSNFTIIGILTILLFIFPSIRLFKQIWIWDYRKSILN